jgi:hypothetical protein
MHSKWTTRVGIATAAAAATVGLLGGGALAAAGDPPSVGGGASADLDSATAAALNIPPIIGVSRSHAEDGYASWTAVSLFGQTLIGRDTDHDHWTGPLGGLGEITGHTNDGTCGDGPLIFGDHDGPTACVEVLPSLVASGEDGGFATGALAYAAVGTQSHGDFSGLAVAVAPSAAEHDGGCTPGSESEGALLQITPLHNGDGEPINILGAHDDAVASESC